MEVWLLAQTNEDANCSCNEIATLEFTGEVDASKLQQAIQKVVQRNDGLRTTFHKLGEYAEVHQELGFGYQTHDWTGLDADESDSRHRELVIQEGRTPFDLENGPLLRVHFQKMESQKSLLTFTAHHVVLDGWSLWVFCRDLGYYYDELVSGQAADLPSSQQYPEYSQMMDAYHQSAAGKSEDEYWRGQFADTFPVLDLPVDRVRPPLKTYAGGLVEKKIDADIVQALRKVAAQNKSSFFQIMLAGFGAYLSRVSQQDDFVVTMPTAGQSALEQHELIGHCVNDLPIRFKVDGKRSLLGLLDQTRERVLGALDHQRYSIGKMIREFAPQRDPSRNPIATASFNIDPEVKSDEIGFTGIDIKLVVEPREFEGKEWFVNGIIRGDGTIDLQCQYNSDLFESETVAQHLESYIALLQSFLQQPDANIDELGLLTISQQQKMIVDWNETAREYPEQCVHELIARQAQQSGDHPAVEFNGDVLTYRDLENRSNQIAHFLQSKSIQKGDLVGVAMTRSADMVAVLIGIWKAGAGYVPLDPEYPMDRLKYMVEHSQLSIIISESKLDAQVAELGQKALFIDTEAQAISQHSDSVINEPVDPTQTAYVIYTSGSTGKPKGVNVPHGAVVNFLESMRNQPGFDAKDRILAVTTLSFDIAVLELYLPLLAGGTVVVADKDTATDGNALIEKINQERISFLQATPATWRMLLDSGWTGSSQMKILCGGEPMPPELVEPLLDCSGEFWNMYGPTETTVWSTVYQITAPDNPILIGRPIDNTQIYLLDERLNPVPQGVPGELYIGGAGVTLGYLHREDLTADRFVDNPYFNPFKNYVSHKLYKTGDLARYRTDGNIEFLRRNDKQVKVRGFRIELGEIEQCLLANEEIKQVAVIVREDQPGDVRLVAYYQCHAEAAIDDSNLRIRLSQSVPHYMVPHHLVELNEFPQTNNGKVDHKALPAPAKSQVANSEASELNTPSEKLLADIWQDLLQIDYVSSEDNFFNIGGHSLLVVQAIARVEGETGFRFKPQDFLMETLQQLAARIQPEEAYDEALRQVKTTEAERESPFQSGPDDGDVNPFANENVHSNDSDFLAEPKGLFDSIKLWWNKPEKESNETNGT